MCHVVFSYFSTFLLGFNKEKTIPMDSIVNV
jgi:hypothetical protein